MVVGRGGTIAPVSDSHVKRSEKVVQKGEKKKKDRKQTVSIGASIEMPASLPIHDGDFFFVRKN